MNNKSYTTSVWNYFSLKPTYLELKYVYMEREVMPDKAVPIYSCIKIDSSKGQELYEMFILRQSNQGISPYNKSFL